MVLTTPPNNFRQVNIYPSQTEILGTRSFVRKNIIDGKFRDVEEYLDIQFRLLREDFVASLREGIANYRLKEPTKTIDIYENVKIFKDRTRSNEECLKIVIYNLNDNDSKKFMNGSLLLFTKNDFTSIFLAKVIQKNTEKAEVTIDLIDSNISDINLYQYYTMAECSKYYDPYYQVLNALQNISSLDFPMKKYIVDVDTSSVYMPKYLIYSSSNYHIDGYHIPPSMLPKLRENLLGLNDAQFKAFQAALTQEFVVIQGPPGTGKTYLGVKIAETLLKNSQFWYKNTPMLVISHKNDALDQFLEGLLPITNKLVRVGGQSKSEKLKEYNLTNEKTSEGGMTFRKRPKEDYLRVMRQALVVGMTTSIAARWKEYLEKLKCPIMIVEEAAEVLEAHVVAALTNSCEHLILLGDHKQLQPIPADHNIGRNYHLGISLFERMVRNEIQFYQLNTQHRMRPEISNLLKIQIYPFLLDHQSVEGRPAILGVDKNMYFIDHHYQEQSCNLTTKMNSHEARFLLCLARHLILNGHKPCDIVILATYAGQVQEMEKLAQNQVSGVKISTLDGFQGQESEIVLLSLVRSDGIGFLAAENRVCVALSRARNGLYIMGNMNLLSKSSGLWHGMKRCLERQNSIGRKLALRCQNHNSITQVESLDDFWAVQNGGCSKKCQSLLSCGHYCSFLCHTKYVKHKCEKGCVGSVGLNEVETKFSSYFGTNVRNGDIGNIDWVAQPQPSFMVTVFMMIKNAFTSVMGYIKDTFLS